MKFKAKKRAILSDFEPFLTLKFAKNIFSKTTLPYRVVALIGWDFEKILMRRMKAGFKLGKDNKSKYSEITPIKAGSDS